MTSSELDPETAVCVGRVVSPQGLGGEVKVQPLTDFPERFERGNDVWIDGTPRRIQRGRWQGRTVLVKLDGINSRAEAEALRDKELMVPDLSPLTEPDRYYLHDIVGLRVEDEAGETLGEVVDVLSTGSNDVYVIRGEQGELLLPAIEDAVKQIDIAGGRIVAVLLPGLEFRPLTPKRARRRPTPQEGASGYRRANVEGLESGQDVAGEAPDLL